jgi:hypothetical protein
MSAMAIRLGSQPNNDGFPMRNRAHTYARLSVETAALYASKRFQRVSHWQILMRFGSIQHQSGGKYLDPPTRERP